MDGALALVCNERSLVAVGQQQSSPQSRYGDDQYRTLTQQTTTTMTIGHPRIEHDQESASNVLALRGYTDQLVQKASHDTDQKLARQQMLLTAATEVKLVFYSSISRHVNRYSLFLYYVVVTFCYCRQRSQPCNKRSMSSSKSWKALLPQDVCPLKSAL